MTAFLRESLTGSSKVMSGRVDKDYIGLFVFRDEMT